MSIIFAPQVLIGENLELLKDIYIEIGTNGIITSISKENLGDVDYSLPPSSVLLPGFINAHTHVGDAFLKDAGYNMTLDDVVGLKGLKHNKFDQSSVMELQQSMKNSLQMLVDNGFTSFIDYREGGTKGCAVLRSLSQSFPINAIILGRPTQEDTINNLLGHRMFADGIGFSTVFDLNQDYENYVADIEYLKPKYPDTIVSLHVSESEEFMSEVYSTFGKTDIQKALELYSVDFVVHANYADISNDFPLLQEKNVGIVCCPLTTAYFGLKFPPIKEAYEYNLTLALGTDNILVTNPDPFRLMFYTLMASKAFGKKLEPKDVLKATTVNPGILSKRKLGQIKEGYSADFVALDLNSPRTLLSHDVYSAITLRASPQDIIFHMFKGRKIR